MAEKNSEERFKGKIYSAYCKLDSLHIIVKNTYISSHQTEVEWAVKEANYSVLSTAVQQALVTWKTADLVSRDLQETKRWECHWIYPPFSSLNSPPSFRYISHSKCFYICQVSKGKTASFFPQNILYKYLLDTWCRDLRQISFSMIKITDGYS